MLFGVLHQPLEGSPSYLLAGEWFENLTMTHDQNAKVNILLNPSLKGDWLLMVDIDQKINTFVFYPWK